MKENRWWSFLTPEFRTSLFCFALVTVLFFVPYITNGTSMDPMEHANEDDSPYPLSVERSAIQCFDFTQLHKKVCMHAGSEIGSFSDERVELDASFVAMVVISNDDGRVPQTSWIEVVEFTFMPRVFIHISDGEVVYSTGKGDTFNDAMRNLVLNFLSVGVEDKERAPKKATIVTI
ncbi:MAG: hypothetical protein NUV61_03920 [Candidatus Azambacteria bacterium]|nr:hypothetical protein [Candidatus Azambacteria bacterium]